MRCYMIRRGSIVNVEMLAVGTDAELIAQAEDHFRKHGGTEKYDGFEVWVGSRFVYRFPPEKAEQLPR